MQKSNPESCMGVLVVGLSHSMFHMRRMRVHVKVPLPLVFMFVRVDPQRFAESPGANPKEHHPHQPFTP